ncbi:hypothetical protein SDC9_189014 [bioreactor metagenome]|uniref:Uncharacterized protein n=1 Tax=bioreactor metagenome TaxID=1076179 RepID=A0A645HQY9_9ZZZZ
MRALRNIAVRRSVEAVTPHAQLFEILPRQAIQVSFWCHGLMEAGIKHRHLRDAGEQMLCGFNPAQIGVIM